MNAVTILVALLALLIPIVGDLRARRPGNLVPIQLISALGAWALVLANASAIAIGIRDGSLVLLCTATATFAIALTSMLRQNAAGVPDRDAPQSLKLVVDDLKQLLGGAPRLGMASLDVVVVGGDGPGIGVAVARKGRVIVRVRRDVTEWIERHRQAGGAGAELVASLARFIVLHELAHVLNGDHRTFRFVRSVLIAQIVWLAGAVAAAVSLFLDREASVRPLVVGTSIMVVFIAQSLIARRFIAERERLADWRAMQTLSPADAARLLERRGRRRALPKPTELEKLMTDLKIHAPARDGGLLSRLIGLVWPEGDDIHQRSERVSNRVGDVPRPVLWAALTGMQCGFLSMSATMAVLLAIAPWMYLRHAASMVMFAIMMWISAPGAMFSGLRVDPARMSVLSLKLARSSVVVGVVFYFAFATSALMLNCFHAHFGFASIPTDLVPAAMLPIAPLVGVCMSVSTLVGARDGGGQLRTMPHSLRVVVFPSLATMALVQVPLSVVASRLIGIGSFRSGNWVPLALMTAAVSAVSSAMARSTNRALRAIVPMALFVTTEPIYGFRLFWRNFYVDVSKTTPARITAVAVATQLVASPWFVFCAALLAPGMRRLLAGQPASAAALFSMLGVMSLILVIPDRFGAYRGPSARLLDTDRLHLFERLLAAARIESPAAANHLHASLARWLRNDRFPDAILPQPEAVWPLEPLLILVRLARATGENAVLERWRGHIEHALRQIVSNDSVAVAPRQPASMYWTVFAATIIDETELRDAFPFERMLDRIETLLDERLEHGAANLVADVVAAWQLLLRHGRPRPDPWRVRKFVCSSSLVSRPLLRQSLAELAEVAELTGDAELRERLGPIVRSRIWEGLQLNPRKDVLLVLDCYLAAARLGELDARHAAASVIIAELAERVSDELMAVVNG
ncbi:MAG TPA: hypothetical protein VGQ65_21700 [Thermoanaerobaculia bacterium]|jgi:hypothetical protein|nr:hypothetical protein [Thermoanaerobaculia bacterium]